MNECNLIQRAVDLIESDLTGIEWKKACRQFVRDSKAHLSTATQEPVAWQQRLASGGWGTILHGNDKPIGEARPLYASPTQEPPSHGVTAVATGDDPLRAAEHEILHLPPAVDHLSPGRKIDRKAALAVVIQLRKAIQSRPSTPAPVVLVEGLREAIARAMCEKDGADWDAQSCNFTANGEEPEEQREYWLDKAEAVLSVLRSAPPVGARVKPLVWNDWPYQQSRAKGVGTIEYVVAWGWENGKAHLTGDGLDVWAETPEAAKAAAQADYEARVLAALLPAGRGNDAPQDQ